MPSAFVLKYALLLTCAVTVISVGLSSGVRLLLGVQSDHITILVRLIMPVLIAFPLAIFAFTWIERLEKSYAQLLREVRELSLQASTDPMTGLLNRRSFQSQFDTAMQHRFGGKFLIADVDYLKTINDRFGHVVGDDAILACANALSTVLGTECLIARIGGDEFCAFLPRGSERNLHELAEAINHEAQEEFRRRSGIEDFAISISVGMGPCPSGSSFRDIMAQTDSDLYRKKVSRPL